MMCTNIYRRSVQLAISIDPHDHSQTLAFSLLEDKTKDGFITFFKSMNKMHMKEIKVMVIDRSEP